MLPDHADASDSQHDGSRSDCEKIGTGTSPLREILAKHRHPLGASPIFSQPRSEPRQVERIAAWAAAGLLGVLVALIGVLALVFLRTQQSFPPLTPENFYEAKARWVENESLNYNIEVAVTGRQAANYYAEVRGGEVVLATRDGELLTRRRTSDTWTVVGMFTTIQADVQHVERLRDGSAERDTPQVVLRGHFDAHNGVPHRYHRTELRRWGPNEEVMWEVTRFELIP